MINVESCSNTGIKRGVLERFLLSLSLRDAVNVREHLFSVRQSRYSGSRSRVQLGHKEPFHAGSREQRNGDGGFLPREIGLLNESG